MSKKQLIGLISTILVIIVAIIAILILFNKKDSNNIEDNFYNTSQEDIQKQASDLQEMMPNITTDEIVDILESGVSDEFSDTVDEVINDNFNPEMGRELSNEELEQLGFDPNDDSIYVYEDTNGEIAVIGIDEPMTDEEIAAAEARIQAEMDAFIATLEAGENPSANNEEKDNSTGTNIGTADDEAIQAIADKVREEAQHTQDSDSSYADANGGSNGKTFDSDDLIITSTWDDIEGTIISG